MYWKFEQQCPQKLGALLVDADSRQLSDSNWTILSLLTEAVQLFDLQKVSNHFNDSLARDQLIEILVISDTKQTCVHLSILSCLQLL